MDGANMWIVEAWNLQTRRYVPVCSCETPRMFSWINHGDKAKQVQGPLIKTSSS